MIKVLAIDHIVLRTAQKAAMLQFYCQILGCQIERELPEEIGLTQLRAGNAIIDIVASDSELGRVGGAAPTKLGNNLDHFCLQIAACEETALLQYLIDNKITASDVKKRYGATGYGRSLYICDPDGNTIELKPVESKST